MSRGIPWGLGPQPRNFFVGCDSPKSEAADLFPENSLSLPRSLSLSLSLSLFLSATADKSQLVPLLGFVRSSVASKYRTNNVPSVSLFFVFCLRSTHTFCGCVSPLIASTCPTISPLRPFHWALAQATDKKWARVATKQQKIPIKPFKSARR